jgi:hypothetical protein
MPATFYDSLFSTFDVNIQISYGILNHLQVRFNEQHMILLDYKGTQRSLLYRCEVSILLGSDDASVGNWS